MTCNHYKKLKTEKCNISFITSVVLTFNIVQFEIRGVCRLENKITMYIFSIHRYIQAQGEAGEDLSASFDQRRTKQ